MDEPKRFGRFYREEEIKRLIKNICIFTIVFIFICAGIQTYMTISKENHIKAAADKELIVKQSQIENMFETFKLIASQSGYNTHLKNFLKENTDKTKLIGSELYINTIKELAAIEKDNPAISMAWVADFDGSFFIETNGYISNDSWTYTDRKWYKEGRNIKTSYVSNPYLSAPNGAKVISIIKPIYDDDERYLGIFALDVEYDFLLNNLSVENAQSKGKLLLVSSDGTVVYSSNKDEFLKPFSEIDFNYKEESKKFVTASADVAMPGWKLIISTPLSELEKGYAEEFANFEIFTAALILIVFMMIIMIFVSKYFNSINTQKISDFDEMTGIYNMRGMTTVIEELLEEEDQYPYFFASFAVRKINILNEMLGFSEVDKLFIHIADCLVSEADKDECYGRISGNKFGIFFKSLDSESAEERLQNLNSNIVKFGIRGKNNLSIQLKIGAYELAGEKDFEKIKSYTDFTLEMAHDNASYESNIVFYDSNFKELHAYEQQLENDMERAVKEDEFEIYIQGKYDVKTSKLRSGEVLVRWNHGEKGLIFPDEFIPLFEKNRFILKLDYVVFEKTCKLIRKWMDAGIEPLPLAVNLSRIHLDHLEVVDKFYACIKKYNISSDMVQIELTESALAENLDNLLDIVKRFKEKEISVAIDDFGTGYSTLSTLKELNFDTLKIDREFFVDMHENERGRAVVRSIIHMAKDLDLETVSEGIETQAQLDFLQEVNGDLVQGFYFSKPIPVKDFEELMLSQRGPVNE